MTKKQLIQALNQDLAGEYQAILMYVTYAAAVTGPIDCQGTKISLIPLVDGSFRPCTVTVFTVWTPPLYQRSTVTVAIESERLATTKANWESTVPCAAVVPLKASCTELSGIADQYSQPK